jgi:hypothetical protein
MKNEKTIDYLIKLVKEKDAPIERYTNLIRTNPIIQDKIFIGALQNKDEIKEKLKNIAIELLELVKIVENSKYKTFEELSADELTECIIEVIEKGIK